VCLYELATRGNPPRRPALETRAEPQPSTSSATAAPTSLDPSRETGAPHLDSEMRESTNPDPACTRDPACARDLALLAGVVEETMQAANYSPRAMRKANRHDLDLLLRRLALTQHDTRRILGLFRRILWRLKR